MAVENLQYWDITYKEVMQLWKISKKAAESRLYRMRKRLKKVRSQKLTVVQFCEAEGISLQEYSNMIKPVVIQSRMF